MENVFLAAMDNGVTRVITSLAAHYNVRLGGQDIDDFPFALIAPLGADQDCVCHEIRKDNKLSRRIRLDTFGTAQNDRMRGCGCNKFRDLTADDADHTDGKERKPGD